MCFVVLIKQHLKVFYLGVEMAIIDRAYYSEHFDFKFVVFGLVYFALVNIEVCTNF